MASSWDLLDPEEENQLHKSRLFSIEEKPFKRITKRLATINQLANRKIRQTLTPPPEPQQARSSAAAALDPEDEDAAAAAAAAAADDDTSLPATDFAQLKEEITLDFAAYDYTIGRLQFLQTANAAQRERYAVERGQILDTCTRVRDNTAALRTQLAAAQATRTQRLAWDALARGILDNSSTQSSSNGGNSKSSTATTTSNSVVLQERPKAMANIAKLEEECRQLEAESETYAATWRERREQFSRIMDESMRLRRLIRDEKEEVERREGMDEDALDGEGDGHTPRPGSASGNATPRPDGGAVASAVPKGLGEDGSGTPGRDSPAPSTSEGGLKPPRSGSGNRSQAGSRDPSPARSAGPGEDVEMGEEATPAPQITVEGEVEDKMDIS